ncbi:MAG TPA: hypothetical protein PKW66_06590 [Polyangiaceae bacterium]|nr:hypothetical protein [Polyangiaceae bacterium]
MEIGDGMTGRDDEAGLFGDWVAGWGCGANFAAGSFQGSDDEL